MTAMDNPLTVSPGLCGECRHASVKETRRGTAYLRCLRATWDPRLVRYPALPVLTCVGFEPLESQPGSEPSSATADE